MSKIIRYPEFYKNWKKLPHHLKTSARKSITLFLKNPNYPSLQNHKLKGKLEGCSAFSVNDDYRIIYKKEDDLLRFYNIGTHNKVY